MEELYMLLVILVTACVAGPLAARGGPPTRLGGLVAGVALGLFLPIGAAQAAPHAPIRGLPGPWALPTSSHHLFPGETVRRAEDVEVLVDRTPAVRDLTAYVLTERGRSLDANSLRDLAWLDHLERLAVVGCDQDPTDALADLLASRSFQESLEVLDLSRCSRAGNQVLQAVAELMALRQLSVGQLFETNPVDSRGVAYLANHPQLEALSLVDTRLGNRALDWIGTLEQLVVLDLTGNEHVSDEGLAMIGRLEGLEDLNLSRTQVTDQGLQELAWLDDLVFLTLRDTRVTGSGMRWLTEAEDLRHLDLSGSPVDDEGLRELSVHGRIQNLSLAGCGRITDRGFAASLPGLRDLEKLDASRTSLGPRSLNALARLPQLQKLDVTDCPNLEGDDLLPLMRVQEMEALDVSRSSVDEATLGALRRKFGEDGLRVH